MHTGVMNDAQRNDEPASMLYFLDKETIKLRRIGRIKKKS